MAKKITNPQPAAVSTAIVAPPPNYLVQSGIAVGLEELQGYMVVPRLIVVQKSSSSERINQHGMGSIVCVPNDVTVAAHGDAVTITPILFFPEWLMVSSIELRNKAPFIRDRSLDPKSNIARLARDPTKWSAPDPEHPGLKVRYLEVLNYVVHVKSPAFNDIAVLGFSKTGHKDGGRWSNLIRARGASIFAGNYEARTVIRSNAQGEWFNIVISNPTGEDTAPWVTEDEFKNYEKAHTQYKSLATAGRLMGADDEDAVGETVAVSDEM